MERMTYNDQELLDMAMETTYAATIREYIAQADTEECRKRLRMFLNDKEHITE